MIEWGNGASKVQVECLTRLDDQQMRVRLSKRRNPDLPDHVVLDEPAGMEFARLRKQALAIDADMNAQFPRPAEPPDEIPGETDFERGIRMAQYAAELQDWINVRHNYRTDPDTPVYANWIVDAINMLNVDDVKVTLDDIAPECFSHKPVQGLMEVWETPLGGPVSPAATPTPPSIPAAPTEPVAEPPNANDAPPSPDSPASTRSSDPGIEPSPPSPPPSSTP